MTYLPLAQIEPFNPVDAPLRDRRAWRRRRKSGPLRQDDSGSHHRRPRSHHHRFRAAVKSIDPNLPLLKITTIDEVVNFMSHDELVSTLTGLFSLLALLLAAIGLYGVMSYNVVRRSNEIGIRIALGAQAQTVLWMILNESLLLLAVGVGLGLPLTLTATQYIKESAFRVERDGPDHVYRCDGCGERDDAVCGVAAGAKGDQGRSNGGVALRLSALCGFTVAHPRGLRE